MKMIRVSVQRTQQAASLRVTTDRKGLARQTPYPIQSDEFTARQIDTNIAYSHQNNHHTVHSARLPP